MEIVCAVNGGEDESAKRKYLELAPTSPHKETKLSVDDPETNETKKQPPCSSATASTSEEEALKWRVQRLREMTDDELLDGMDDEDLDEAKKVIDTLRTYHIQVAQSEGFDVDVWPGSFFGITTVIPVDLINEGPVNYAEYETLAKYAMDEHNKIHKTEFEFEQLEKACVWLQMYTQYYLTFSARDQNANRETFQGMVVVNTVSDEEDKYLALCRPKRNIWCSQ